RATTMRTLGFLGLLFGTLAQAHTGCVKGRVIDDLAAPVDNALVQVTSAATGRTFSMRTNANGEYTMRAVDLGTHLEVLVRRIGFKPARFTLSGTETSSAVVGNVQLLPVAPVMIL